MDKGDPVRKTKTHKPAQPKKGIKLIEKALPSRKEKRQNEKKKRENYKGFIYGKNTQKGAFGKNPMSKEYSAPLNKDGLPIKKKK